MSREQGLKMTTWDWTTIPNSEAGSSDDKRDYNLATSDIERGQRLANILLRIVQPGSLEERRMLSAVVVNGQLSKAGLGYVQTLLGSAFNNLTPSIIDLAVAFYAERRGGEKDVLGKVA